MYFICVAGVTPCCRWGQAAWLGGGCGVRWFPYPAGILDHLHIFWAKLIRVELAESLGDLG